MKKVIVAPKKESAPQKKFFVWFKKNKIFTLIICLAIPLLAEFI